MTCDGKSYWNWWFGGTPLFVGNLHIWSNASPNIQTCLGNPWKSMEIVHEKTLKVPRQWWTWHPQNNRCWSFSAEKKLIRDQSILIIFWLAEFGTLPVCDLRLSHGRLCIGGIPSFRHTQISHRLLPYIQIISHYACKMVRLFIPIICQSSRLWNVWYSHYPYICCLNHYVSWFNPQYI